MKLFKDLSDIYRSYCCIQLEIILFNIWHYFVMDICFAGLSMPGSVPRQQITYK